MARITRKTTEFRGGDILEVSEHYDGRSMQRSDRRGKKRKATPEQIEMINRINKAKRCRHRLLEYFDTGDLFVTLTYAPEQRPKDMAEALKDYQRFVRRVRTAYKKAGKQLYWIRNIEQGTRGAWHIHAVINEIGGSLEIIQNAWDKGGIWSERLKNSKYYDKDFSALAEYLTKDEHTLSVKADGGAAKARLRQASYNTSKNMPLPEPKIDELHRWKKEVKPKKGYYIYRIHEGINPDGYPYRRYTMIRLMPVCKKAEE